MRVAVVGASGWAGRELCRLLLGHPLVDEVIPVVRDPEQPGLPPAFSGADLRPRSREWIETRYHEFDFLFLSAPTGVAMRTVPQALATGCRVIDLSADFRFNDPGRFELAHGLPHEARTLLAEAVSGITEHYRSQIRGARLVANPGCYAVATLLAILPLLQGSLVNPAERISIAAVNGMTGAGMRPRAELQLAEAAASMLSYDLDGHRHSAEIADQVGRLATTAPTVDLMTAHGPFARGIHAMISVPLRTRLDRREVQERFADAYDAEPFVTMVTADGPVEPNSKSYERYPTIGDVRGTNQCRIGFDIDRTLPLLRLVSVVDNLGRGAAGSAVQNFNVMNDWPETSGLEALAV